MPVNTLYIDGTVADQPERREWDGGFKFEVPVLHRGETYRSKSGETVHQDVDMRLVAEGKNERVADIASRLRRGDAIVAKCRLVQRNYTSKGGEPRSFTSYIVDDFLSVLEGGAVQDEHNQPAPAPPPPAQRQQPRRPGREDGMPF